MEKKGKASNMNLKLVIILFGLAEAGLTKTSLDIVMESLKKININLSASRPENLNFLGISWWVDYRQTFSSGLQDLMHEPLIRVVGVSSQHIYVKRYEQSFF